MRAGAFVNFNVNLQQLRDNADIHQWLASTLSPQSLKVKAQQSARRRNRTKPSSA